MRIASLNLLQTKEKSEDMVSAISMQLIQSRNENLKACMSDFQGKEHKLEFVKKINNIEFIDDSKSSNINATWFALESMTKPIIWIAAANKDLKDFTELETLVKNKVKLIIGLGFDKTLLEKHFTPYQKTICLCTNMQDAVMKAFYAAKQGDVILCSPAGNSFELYKDYKERGNDFKNEVAQL